MTVRAQDRKKVNVLISLAIVGLVLICGEMYWISAGGKSSAAATVEVVGGSPGLNTPAAPVSDQNQGIIDVPPLVVAANVDPFRTVLPTEPTNSAPTPKDQPHPLSGNGFKPIPIAVDTNLSDLGIRVEGVILGGDQPLAIISFGGADHVVGLGAVFGDGIILDRVSVNTIVVHKGKEKITIPVDHGLSTPAAKTAGSENTIDLAKPKR